MRYYKQLLYKISAVLILASAALYISSPIIASWIMIVSVVIFTGITLSTPYPGNSLRGKRLFNMQIVSCLFMLAAAYLMFTQDNLWALSMLAGTIFLLYTSIFIPKELKKEGYKEDDTN